MKKVKVPKILIAEKELKAGVKKLAKILNQDYQGEEVVIICVLKGSFIFCADLVRYLDFPVTIEFISVSSYGAGKKSSGEVKLNFDLTPCVEGKNLLIVEDIIDTGLTIDYLFHLFKARKPKSLKLATLLFRKSTANKLVNVDYKAFDLADEFVVGYGLDYGGQFRSLPYLGYIDD